MRQPGPALTGKIGVERILPFFEGVDALDNFEVPLEKLTLAE